MSAYSDAVHQILLQIDLSVFLQKVCLCARISASSAPARRSDRWTLKAHDTSPRLMILEPELLIEEVFATNSFNLEVMQSFKMQEMYPQTKKSGQLIQVFANHFKKKIPKTMTMVTGLFFFTPKGVALLKKSKRDLDQYVSLTVQHLRILFFSWSSYVLTKKPLNLFESSFKASHRKKVEPITEGRRPLEGNPTRSSPTRLLRTDPDPLRNAPCCK